MIDHIHSNIINKRIHARIVITDISDHFGTFCLIQNFAKKETNHLSTD